MESYQRSPFYGMASRSRFRKTPLQMQLWCIFLIWIFDIRAWHLHNCKVKRRQVTWTRLITRTTSLITLHSKPAWLTEAPPLQWAQPLRTTPLAFPVRTGETGQSWQVAPVLITNTRWEVWIYISVCSGALCVCVDSPPSITASLQTYLHTKPHSHFLRRALWLFKTRRHTGMALSRGLLFLDVGQRPRRKHLSNINTPRCKEDLFGHS